MASLPAFRRGDFIGEGLQVLEVLGEGGFGIVYLIAAHDSGETLAVKTVRSELLRDDEGRALFLKEARIWIDLGAHPYLVRARWLSEINGRPYLAMEYVRGKPGEPNSLDGHLRRQPPALPQALAWAIQFCHGMEYAYSRGIRCHRDIKPANILIGEDGRIRISDFGIAGLAQSSDAFAAGPDASMSRLMLNAERTAVGSVFGTPTHMAPEQFRGAALCDERSDLYSFGVVLYQLAARGRLPFVPGPPAPDDPAPAAHYFMAFRQLHEAAAPPRLASPLWPLVARALRKNPADRHPGFAALRQELEALYRVETRREPELPPVVQETAADLSNRGLTLANLGRLEEAVQVYDRALALEPSHAAIHANRAVALRRLGRLEEAMASADRAIELAPFGATSWLNKGLIHVDEGRVELALFAFDRSLALDPTSADAWVAKATILGQLGRAEEELGCLEEAIRADPRSVIAWYNRGCVLSTRRDPSALDSLDRALALDPRHEGAWSMKGVLLSELGRHEEAIACMDEALRLAPGEARNWYNKGNALTAVGRMEEALACFVETTRLAPRFPTGWYNRGLAACQLRRPEEAMLAFVEFLGLAPADDPMRPMAQQLSLALLSGEIPEIRASRSTERIGEPAAAPKPASHPGSTEAGASPGSAPAATTPAPPPAPRRPPTPPPAPPPAARPAASPATPAAEKSTPAASAPATTSRPSVPTSAETTPSTSAPSRPAAEGLSPAVTPTAVRAPALLPRPAVPQLPAGTLAHWNDRATGLFAARRYAEALEAARAALRIDARSPTSLNNAANALFMLGQAEQAIETHDRLLEIAPVFLPSWASRAAMLARLGRKPEALRGFLETIEVGRDEPSNPQVKQASAEVAALQGAGVRPAPRTHQGFLAAGCQAMVRQQGDLAISLFDQAIAAAPRRVACWEWKATALRELERFDEALACLASAARQLGEDCELQHARGMVLVRLRRFEEAIAAFEDAIRADPLNPAPWSDRGKALGVLRRNEEALDSLARACELAPQHPAPWQNRALVEETLQRFEAAACSFTRFLECATPDMRAQVEHARARIPLLQAQARARRGEPLSAPATPSVALPPERPMDVSLPSPGQPPAAGSPAAAGPVAPPGGEPGASAFGPVPGRSAVPAGEPPETVVLRAAEVPAVSVGMPFSDALQRAEICLNQNQAERAAGFFDQAIAARPDNVNAWAGKADALFRLGRHREAIGHCDRALALNPGLTAVWQRRASSCEALKLHAEALSSCDKGLAVAPRNVALLNSRGLALFSLRRYDEALAAFDAVLALDARHALARFNRAESLLALERPEEAARALRQFLGVATEQLAPLVEQARHRLSTLEGP